MSGVAVATPRGAAAARTTRWGRNTLLLVFVLALAYLTLLPLPGHAGKPRIVSIRR